MRVYDPRLGRFLSVDPITKDYPELTPYQFAGNMPIHMIDLDGLEPTAPRQAGQAPQLDRGNLAHKLFTNYIRAMDPSQVNWKANRQIGNGVRLRPDLIYFNGPIGGVWEMKPVFPSPSAFLAYPEALLYAALLNLAQKTTIYHPGTSGGAPVPFTGILNLTDPGSQRSFTYALAPPIGAIFYKETTSSSQPTVNVPVPSPSGNPSTPTTPILLVQPVVKQDTKPTVWPQPFLNPQLLGPNPGVKTGYPGQGVQQLIKQLFGIDVPPPVPVPAPIVVPIPAL